MIRDQKKLKRKERARKMGRFLLRNSPLLLIPGIPAGIIWGLVSLSTYATDNTRRADEICVPASLEARMNREALENMNGGVDSNGYTISAYSRYYRDTLVPRLDAAIRATIAASPFDDPLNRTEVSYDGYNGTDQTADTPYLLRMDASTIGGDFCRLSRGQRMTVSEDIKSILIELSPQELEALAREMATIYQDTSNTEVERVRRERERDRSPS